LRTIIRSFVIARTADGADLLLDLKDLRAMLQYVGDKARQFTRLA